ncbi:potassium transporter 4-like [Silene latifolia]|uniref:potassium transporter 4-like n=1 Tax=Silene latifolia TaxID=37657 RepID=UPI003D76AAB8
MSTYKYGHSGSIASTAPVKRFLEKQKQLRARRAALLLLVLFGASMVIGEGVLTPSISEFLHKSKYPEGVPLITVFIHPSMIEMLDASVDDAIERNNWKRREE